MHAQFVFARSIAARVLGRKQTPLGKSRPKTNVKEPPPDVRPGEHISRINAADVVRDMKKAGAVPASFSNAFTTKVLVW